MGQIKSKKINQGIEAREKLNISKFNKLTEHRYNFEDTRKVHVTNFLKLVKEYEKYKAIAKFQEYKLPTKVMEYLYNCAINAEKFNLDKLREIEESVKEEK